MLRVFSLLGFPGGLWQMSILLGLVRIQRGAPVYGPGAITIIIHFPALVQVLPARSLMALRSAFVASGSSSTSMAALRAPSSSSQSASRLRAIVAILRRSWLVPSWLPVRHTASAISSAVTIPSPSRSKNWTSTPSSFYGELREILGDSLRKILEIFQVIAPHHTALDRWCPGSPGRPAPDHGRAVLVPNLFQSSMRLAQSGLVGHFGQRLQLGLTLEFGQKLLRLPMSYFDRHRSGEVVSRLADISRINNLIAEVVFGLPSQALARRARQTLSLVAR